MIKGTYYPPSKRIEKLNKEELLDLTFDLINAFRLVNSSLDTAFLIQDLFTAGEIKNLAKRLRIAKLLLLGKTQREVASTLKCSLATVTKVNLWINRGGEGFKKVISKLPPKYEKPEKLPPGPLIYNLPDMIMTLGSYALATVQEKPVEKLIENIDDKKTLDKNLRDAFTEEFRNNKKRK